MIAEMTCPLIAELRDRLLAIGSDLTVELEAANEQIREDTLWTIDALYPAGTLYAWQSEINTVMDAVASVTVKTDDEILYWYEYGTKPHEEVAGPGSAMAFAGTNEYSDEYQVVQVVQHPGEQAHPNAGSVMLAMETAARTVWTEAISKLLFSVL